MLYPVGYAFLSNPERERIDYIFNLISLSRTLSCQGSFGEIKAFSFDSLPLILREIAVSRERIAPRMPYSTQPTS
jgi:hypothetical protein